MQTLALALSLMASMVAAIVLLLYLRLRRRRRRELAAMARVHDRLLSIISHDLRNPALAQRNALGLMLNAADSFPPDVLKEQCQLLLADTHQQICLIQNLLSWSALRFGSLTYDPVRFDMASVVDDATEPLLLSARSRGVSIESTLPAGSVALSDRAMFSTVVRNLVGSIVGLSPQGSTVVLTLGEQQAGWWPIRVQGAGAATERAAHLFDMETSSKGGGSGLWLPMCRELVERWGGSITVDKPERGLCITFTVQSA